MITGFLESGKTSFLQDIVTDEDFTEGQRCLLIVCEEGEVEYNNEDLCGNNITMITVDEEEKMNTDFLKYCIRQYTPKKIFIEMNGMWDINGYLSGDRWIVWYWHRSLPWWMESPSLFI